MVIYSTDDFNIFSKKIMIFVSLYSLKMYYHESKSRPFATQRQFHDSNAGNFNYFGETNFVFLRYSNLVSFSPSFFLKVIEYMQSVSYRQVQESSNKYRELLKNKRHASYLEKIQRSEEYQDSSKQI